MSLIQVDLVGWLPDSLKQQIIDSVVTFVADQAKKALGDEVSQTLKRLRSDAAFQDAVDRGLKEATDRFVREYMVEDEDLVAAIARDPDFWKAESVREALLEIVRHPGVYLAEERMALAQSFADVLRQRVNRERVDRAVAFYLRCVAESLWHLEQLRPVYDLQMQRLSVERATEMVQELRGMRADVQGAMVALVQAIGEQQKLLAAPDRFVLPEPKEVYHNLPQPDYGRFIGREKELAQVHRILRPYPHSQEHLVTIDGIGGIGKSALALEVAHRYLRDYDRLPSEERFEAIIWTSAKATVLTADGIAPRQQITRTLDDIYTTISVALEREDITRARPEEQDELVVKALTWQRTLLIVDNLETVDDERVNAFLRELPAPTKAIVTTRHRIDVAYPVRLTGMPKGEGLALIAQECAKKGVTLTEADAEKLYDRTGGVPLAIVWSVAQMGYGYSVEAVLRRLGQPSEDIARYCFEGTVEYIRGEDAHKLLMALALFATDASREALGCVAGFENDVISRDKGLVQLEKLSLVDKQGGRFRMLPLTRIFVLREFEANADFSKRVKRDFVSYLSRLVRERLGSDYWAGLSQWESYDTIPVDIDSTLAAIDLGAEMGLWREVRDIAIGIVHLLWWMGLCEQRIRVSTIAITAARVLGLPGDEAWLRTDGLGWVYLALGEYDKALSEIQEGRSIGQMIGDADIVAQADCLHARVLFHRREYNIAESILLQAFESDCSSRIRGHLLESLSHLKLLQGDVSAAQRCMKESVSIRRALGDLPAAAFGLVWLGHAYVDAGNLGPGRAAFEDAIRLADEIEDLRTKARATLGLGLVELEAGNLTAARRLIETARESFASLGMRLDVAEVAGVMERLNTVQND